MMELNHIIYEDKIAESVEKANKMYNELNAVESDSVSVDFVCDAIVANLSLLFKGKLTKYMAFKILEATGLTLKRKKDDGKN